MTLQLTVTHYHPGARTSRCPQAYRFLANVTHCQLLPLLFRRQEWVLKMLVWWAHASLVAIVFPCSRDDKLASGAGSLGRQGVREGSLRALVARLLAAYEWGLVLLPEVVEVLQRMWLPGTLCPFLCLCLCLCRFLSLALLSRGNQVQAMGPCV
jgi:hypothetical protein